MDATAVFDTSNEPVKAAEAAINSLFDIDLIMYFSVTNFDPTWSQVKGRFPFYNSNKRDDLNSFIPPELPSQDSNLLPFQEISIDLLVNILVF